MDLLIFVALFFGFRVRRSAQGYEGAALNWLAARDALIVLLLIGIVLRVIW